LTLSTEKNRMTEDRAVLFCLQNFGGIETMAHSGWRRSRSSGGGV
jgi:hypothetical protein